MKNLQLSNDLIDFLYKSPTAFHAASNSIHLLEGEGFKELNPNSIWKLKNGDKNFIRVNDSCVIAFAIGEETSALDGFKIIGAHTDSPSLKIKPASEITQDGYFKLNVEVYGGPILNTWLDRPLGIAGRITLKGKNAFKPENKLVNINEPIAYIPNLAIHMNREVNKGVELNRQVDMLPMLGLVTKEFEKENFLLKLVAEKANINVEDILDFDLYLYEYEKGCLYGMNKEFISASRLDDLSMVYAGLVSLTSATKEKFGGINVLALFDNEEIGSTTKQGANSPLLSNTLERITLGLGFEREVFLAKCADSFMISADGAHAVHPNTPGVCDPTNKPKLNGGLVIKASANQRYTTDSESSAVFKALCDEVNVPYQMFVNKSDLVGGSTIGPISASQLPIRSVDMGPAMLAMHSIRETAGVDDLRYCCDVFLNFYKYN